MTDKNKSDFIPIYGKNSSIKTKQFETLDEFNQFYKLHKEEIDEMTTNKLNRLYHIKDYKITRRKIGNNEDSGASTKGVKTLCFQQIKPTSKENNDDLNERIEELETSISDLNNKMKNIELENSKIKSQLIEIIKAINNSSN